MRVLLLVAAAMLILVNSTKAEMLFNCGASEGKTYFLPGKHFPDDKAGWVDNGIDGSFSFLTLEDGSFDLIFTDATGRSMSTRGDGGKVSLVYAADTMAQFFVHYPGTGVAETYTIFGELGLVAWTQVKAATPIQAMSAFIAPCS